MYIHHAQLIQTTNECSMFMFLHYNYICCIRIIHTVFILFSPSLPHDTQAIDSYEAQGDGQVSFEEGDIIQVLDKIEDGKSLFMKKIKKTGGCRFTAPERDVALTSTSTPMLDPSGCYV